MTFASARQIVLLILLTAIVLFGIDRFKNPQRERVPGEPGLPSAGADEPMIRLRLNDLSCGGCLGGLEAALSEVTWLEAPKVLAKPAALEHAETPDAGSEPRQQTVIEIKIPEAKLRSVDFVVVVAALQRAGFAAAQIEFSGLPHYRLEAELAPLCSPGCVQGTREAMDDLVRASKPKGWLRWLDSYSVDGVNRALVFFPRIGATVDVMEVLGAINTIGFEAGSLTIHVHGPK